MTHFRTLSAIAFTSSIMLGGCLGDGSNSSDNSSTNTEGTGGAGNTGALTCDNDITVGADRGITALPASSSAAYSQLFCKYTEIVANNGKPIRIYAQNTITNAQLIRARRILEFFLEPVAGSEQGSDKTALANGMADNGAKLLLMNGSDDGTNDAPDDAEGQPLYATELIVEGSAAYINNDYENHRDAAFEEILHLVHAYGIDPLDPDAAQGTSNSYKLVIDAARKNAMSNALWPTAAAAEEVKSWIEELRLEGSLSHEYLASVIDSYYGYWGAFEESDGGMWGIYTAKTRENVAQLDPQGYAVVEQFFNPVVTYTASIDDSFDGSFNLSFDALLPYTYKSQYLVNAELRGSNNSDLVGNAFDNRLEGNAGSNVLDGKAGNDTAVLKGNSGEYAIDVIGDEIVIQDSIAERDGVVTLKNIEQLEFQDGQQKFVDGVLESVI